MPFLAPGALDAVLIDLDGTLVDTLGDFAAACNAMLQDLKLPHIAPAAIATMVGQGSEHLIRSVLRHVRGVPADAALYDAAWASYMRHYEVVNGRHAPLFAGVPEGLEALRRRGLRRVCLTNKPGAFAQALLAAKGLGDEFDFVFGGDAFERKKPDPMPLLKACEALGTAPARTLMLGDSRNDAQAARAAGCPVLLVSYGFNHGESVHGVDADGVLDSMAELEALLPG